MAGILIAVMLALFVAGTSNTAPVVEQGTVLLADAPFHAGCTMDVTDNMVPAHYDAEVQATGVYSLKLPQVSAPDAEPNSESQHGTDIHADNESRTVLKHPPKDYQAESTIIGDLPVDTGLVLTRSRYGARSDDNDNTMAARARRVTPAARVG
jgi:hypothetical protein